MNNLDIKRLDKKILEDYYLNLPIFLREKSKNIKLIASFILKNMLDYEWFRLLKIKENAFLNACYFSNIGSINNLNRLYGFDLTEINDTFLNYLVDVINYGSFNYNNNGIGNKRIVSGKNIPIIGRIYKVCNDINDVLKSNNNDYESLFKYLNINSNVYYDPDIILMINNNKDVFIYYLDYSLFKKKNKKI